MTLVAARMVFGQYAKSHDLILGCQNLAAVRPNGRFFGGKAALVVTHLRQLSRCKRTQRKIITSATGSLLPLAASQRPCKTNSVPFNANGPNRTLAKRSTCYGAARQTGLSLQPRNRVMGEFSQCWTKWPYIKHEPTSAYLSKAAIRNSRSDR
jgi:hypothetical protein